MGLRVIGESESHLLNIDLSRPLRPFRSRDFRLYALGQILNLAGNRINDVAAGWLMWSLTGSLGWLGLLATVNLAPRLVLWPLAGLMADRVSAGTAGALLQGVSTVLAAAMALLATWNMLSPPLLLVFTGLLGVTSALWLPIRLNMIHGLVPTEEITPALASSAIMANVARVIGPMMAAPLMLWGGVALGFWANAIGFALAGVCQGLIRKTPPEAPQQPEESRLLAMAAGIRYVRDDPVFFRLFVSMGLFALSVRAVLEVLPAYADLVLGGDSGTLAMLISAMGAGSFAAGLLLAWGSRSDQVLRWLIVSSALSAGCLPFMIVGGVTAAYLAVAMASFGLTVQGVGAQLLIQLRASSEVRGRVLGFYIMVFNSLPAVGALALAGISTGTGLGYAFWVAAAVGLIVTLVLALSGREHRW